MLLLRRFYYNNKISLNSSMKYSEVGKHGVASFLLSRAVQ